MNAGQPHVASAETESASGMVYAKEMKHGGMKIVDLISIFDRLVSEFVRITHTDPFLDATSGKPHGETEGIVVATIDPWAKGVRPNSSPDDQGRVQKTESTKIGDQGGNWLINGLTVLGVSVLQFVVLIPPVTIASRTGQLDEAYAPLDQTPGSQALKAESSGVLKTGIHPVSLLDGLGLALKVHEFGNGALHEKSGFVISNGGFDLWIAIQLGKGFFVHIAKERQLGLLQFFGRLAPVDVGNRLRMRAGKPNPDKSQEENRIQTIQSAWRDQSSVEHHEPGKIAVLGTEAVPKPGSHARPALKAIPRM